VSGKFAPENGTSGHGGSIWLTWSAVEDSGYWVCWDTTDNDTCDGDNWHANGGSASKLITGLAAGTYYWQVHTLTGSTVTPANGGVWWRFTVGADTSEPGSGSSSVTREYIYLGSMLLAAVEAGSTLTYYHSDALGSVRAITSASGSTVTRHDYFPFGENTSALSGDPRKYIGGEQDAETAFDYLGARYNRNTWGRFTSVDPVIVSGAMSNPQLWNRYAYGLNSPLNFSDPTGLAPQENPALDVVDSEVNVEAYLLAEAFSNLRWWGAGVEARIQNDKIKTLLASPEFKEKLNSAIDAMRAGPNADSPMQPPGAGFRESGFVVWEKGGKIEITLSPSGPYQKDPRYDFKMTIIHPEGDGWKPFVQVHLHPDGNIGTVARPEYFPQLPSDNDRAQALGQKFRPENFAVISVRDQMMYFYNGMKTVPVIRSEHLPWLKGR
jgi:RHS repeat-associated protein